MDTNINPDDTQNQPYESIRTEAPSTPQPEPSYVRVSQRPVQPGIDAEPARKRKRVGGLPALMLTTMLILGVLFGGAGAGAVMLLAGHVATNNASSTASNSSKSSAASASLVAQPATATINTIYEKLSPSVVMITAEVQTSNGRFSTSGEAIGTGMIIDTKGDIVTNYHVIDSATSLTIQLQDGTEYKASVVGTAPQDDLALIKADIASDKLVSITLGDSSTVKVGDEVIAIGYPYGLDQSVSEGIVSGLDRTGSGSADSRSLSGLIQVDAAINPGNSGGPLVNATGQVIGIDTMIESPVEGFTGVGLAIPINQLKDILPQLEQGQEVQTAWLGISGVDITSSMQQEYNLSVSQGILVMSVTSGSPAAEAGLQASTIQSSQFQQTQAAQIGDIIVAIDSKQTTSTTDLTSYLNTKQPGDEVTLTIVRDSKQQNLTATLQAWPASAVSSS
jgi:S1-C subfamily serine protease